MLKKLQRSILVFALAAFASPAFAQLKVFEVLATKGGDSAVTQIASKLDGVGKEAAQQAYLSLKQSFEALNGGKEVVNVAAVRRIFQADSALAAIASKNIDELSKAELVTLINKTAQMAQGRKLGELIMACSQCVHEELLKLGITYVAKQATEEMSKVLKSTLKGAALQSTIVKKAEAIKKAGYNFSLGIDEVRAIGRTGNNDLLHRINGFVDICTKGTPGRRAFCLTSISLITDEKGVTDFANNRLFMMAFEDLSDDEFKALSDSLSKSLGDVKGASAKVKREAFEKWVNESLEKGGRSAEEVDQLKAQLRRCGYIG